MLALKSLPLMVYHMNQKLEADIPKIYNMREELNSWVYVMQHKEI